MTHYCSTYLLGNKQKLLLAKNDLATRKSTRSIVFSINLLLNALII